MELCWLGAVVGRLGLDEVVCRLWLELLEKFGNANADDVNASIAMAKTRNVETER